jgi:ATP-dependent RNA helicase DeaD
MTLPSRKDITDRRIGLFREMIAETMESQDLEFFEELIDNYQDEYDVGLRRIAATLAYLVQKDKPLQMEGGAEEKVEAAPEAVDRPRVREKTGDSRRYRIEVGRIHGVEPRHIVGAISNEAQLSSTHIGQIKLHDAFSLVDLPADLPKETIRLLKDVWVCGQRLQLSLDGGRPESGKEKPFKKRPGKKVEKAVRAKPIGKKPPVKRKSKGEN